MQTKALVTATSVLLIVLGLNTRTVWAQAAAEAGALAAGAAQAAQGAGTGAPAAAAPAQAAPAQAAPAQAAPAQEAPAQAAPAPGQQPPPPAVDQAVEGPAPLRVMVGKSLLITTADRIRRVSVTDSSVADALVVTPTQILVHGRAPGEISLIVWNEAEQSRSFDLRVDVDTTAAAEEIHHVMPDQRIEVSASRNALVLSGHVATKEDADRAGLLAGAFTKNVVNALTFGPVGADEILLEVKFAEVDRTALFQYGTNLFSTGAANTFGATSTQQFAPFTGTNVGAVPFGVTQGTVTGNNVATGAVGNGNFHQPGSFGTNDLLNLFLFRTDINLGAIVKLLQQKNILQLLAEPNLIAANGKEASFLAGGEFPFPVPQGISGAVTIQFKEFGVRLNFVPVITPAGRIYLKVTPEVSSLDFSNALTLSGFVIPALSVRRAQTELEIQDGQSFIIAGLMDNRVTDIVSKLPGLGDLPVLGTFFKSKNQQKTKTELMVLVTAHRVNPALVPPTLPKFPEPFMDQKSDKKDMGQKSDTKAGTSAGGF